MLVRNCSAGFDGGLLLEIKEAFALLYRRGLNITQGSGVGAEPALGGGSAGVFDLWRQAAVCEIAIFSPEGGAAGEMLDSE